jgi:hypothetical protein
VVQVATKVLTPVDGDSFDKIELTAVLGAETLLAVTADPSEALSHVIAILVGAEVPAP